MTFDTLPATSEDLGIRQVATATGLTPDTLRWYEREGLIPAVPRGVDGRRRYDERTRRMIALLMRLRRTGMPVAQMRTFVELLGEGAASHERRLALLEEHRVRVLEQMTQLTEDLDALDDKIDHYRTLIAAGLDCGEQPIDNLGAIAEERRIP